MAVAVKDCFAIETGQREILRPRFQKLAEQESLAGQGLGALVVRKEIYKLIAKDGDATGLETDDRNAGSDFGREFVEDLTQE
jgi:hypothetical protein